LVALKKKVSRVLIAIKRLRTENPNEGKDCIKLSLIFNLTIKPPSIKRNRPVEAKNKIKVLKYNPSNKPNAPNNWRKPVSFLKPAKL